MRDVYIVGVGQHPVTKDQDIGTRHLGERAVRAAMADAGIAGEQVDAMYVGNMLSGILCQQQQLGGLIADYSGMLGVEAVTIEAACAAGGAAARLGYQTIAGGLNDIVVVCGLEQMTHVDRDVATRALATAADWELEGACGETFLSLNARLMRTYMAAYGTRPEDFAPFAITAHANAATNQNALLHKEISMEAYLHSRMIVDPVRLFDASPLCDGAAAVILASAEAARSLEARPPAIRIAGSATATSSLALSRRRDPLQLDAVEISTRKALQQAGVRHEDIDLFELHDAYTIITVLSLESSGFAEPGTGTRLGTEGRIGLRGELPLSTMGGLKARGHPVGATGVYQLVEAYLQLTGAAGPNQVLDPEVALVQNMGGTGATVVSHVLSRDD